MSLRAKGEVTYWSQLKYERGVKCKLKIRILLEPYKLNELKELNELNELYLAAFTSKPKPITPKIILAIQAESRGER